MGASNNPPLRVQALFTGQEFNRFLFIPIPVNTVCMDKRNLDSKSADRELQIYINYDILF